jgi:hypothetical protein
VDIWQVCEEKIRRIPLAGTIYRIVESQEQIATHHLVDDLEEQAVLENLLENTKPPPPKNSTHFHYLLYTPFRYPPLEYGSRFGSRHEPSLFYGSRSLQTALAECAFYRLYFWQGMLEPPPSKQITTQHTAFTATIKTTEGLQLHAPPFDAYQAVLTHRSSYQATQQLGSAMRENQIAAFEYESARDSEGGINVGLFNLDALRNKKPSSFSSLLCTTGAESVKFMDNTKTVYPFSLEQFLEQGQFPQPAN